MPSAGPRASGAFPTIKVEASRGYVKNKRLKMRISKRSFTMRLNIPVRELYDFSTENADLTKSPGFLGYINKKFTKTCQYRSYIESIEKINGVTTPYNDGNLTLPYYFIVVTFEAKVRTYDSYEIEILRYSELNITGAGSSVCMGDDKVLVVNWCMPRNYGMVSILRNNKNLYIPLTLCPENNISYENRNIIASGTMFSYSEHYTIYEMTASAYNPGDTTLQELITTFNDIKSRYEAIPGDYRARVDNIFYPYSRIVKPAGDGQYVGFRVVNLLALISEFETSKTSRDTKTKHYLYLPPQILKSTGNVVVTKEVTPGKLLIEVLSCNTIIYKLLSAWMHYLHMVVKLHVLMPTIENLETNSDIWRIYESKKIQQ